MIKNCKHCETIILDKIKIFCNSSCAASFNNAHRLNGKRVFSKEALKNLSNGNKKRSLKCIEFYNKNKSYCTICRSELPYEKRENQVCSNKCKNELSSINRSKVILQRGTDNFKTKSENFNYGFLKEFRVDSKLEKAGLIYLIDELKMQEIEKFTSILNFKEGDVTRRFNPDFYCKKDGKIYIVEVKMKWIKTSTHIYNRTIPLKKEALKKFCVEREFEMIWLDFDYDTKLKKIYKTIIS